MKTIASTLAATVASIAAASLLGFSGPANAASPHFVSGSAALNGNDITVSFKEAGLGSSTTVTIQAEASYTAVFQCINGGGKNPSAANKTTVTGSAAESGTFTSGKNGQVTGTLTLDAPDVNDNDFSCPSGQKETLTQLTWSQISLHDLTSGADSRLQGGYSLGEVI